MVRKLGLGLMFLSGLAVGYFISLYLEGRLFVVGDVFYVAIGLIAAFFVAIRYPVVGGIMGFLVALYPLIVSIQNISKYGDDVYYIYYYIVATSILVIASSLLVVGSRIIR